MVYKNEEISYNRSCSCSFSIIKKRRNSKNNDNNNNGFYHNNNIFEKIWKNNCNRHIIDFLLRNNLIDNHCQYNNIIKH